MCPSSIFEVGFDPASPRLGGLAAGATPRQGGFDWVCFGILLAFFGFELALIGFVWLCIGF